MSYFDRQGNPQTFQQYVALRHSDPDYDVVALTKLNDVDVSTLFFGAGITGPHYETMVLGGALDLEAECCSTEAEALAGHAAWVEKVRASQQVAS